MAATPKTGAAQATLVSAYQAASSSTLATGLKLVLKRPRPPDNDEYDQEDKDYVPPRKSPNLSEADTNSDVGIKNPKAKGKGKGPPVKRKKRVEPDDSLSEVKVEEVE
ncbi:hypothetical protein PAXRUDRAFT_19433 [Paxillus rubicundulus Ve08.2h10]|uniref:Unplaced genomic scaffold scaffold_3656, whole genome shotgun sequence n=1 Tax=Paxillus rubicundulus Ve08.2h10 TaxID=930991 RepID=A0A0D0DCA1_9AGAM|nr:hypothetical protein PAXRUDRAFT_19433 [Paxillus rubicundulus Ve08.2h10]